MRRRKQIEVVGLSFLDMICCAFGGIVVLYAVSPRTAAVGSPFQNSTELVVELGSGDIFDVGVAFTIDGNRIRCWADACGGATGTSVSWLHAGGEIRALISGTSSPVQDVRVALLGGVGLMSETCVTAFVRESSREITVPLRKEHAFRARADFSKGNETC